MSIPPDINDSLIDSANKAANGSDIIHRVGNDPEGSFIETLSGPTPSIKEWFSQKSVSIDAEVAEKIESVTEQAAAAEASADRSESAASMASAFINPSADTAEGLGKTSGTGTTNRWFTVPVAGSTTLFTLYLNNAGAPVNFGQSPSVLAVTANTDAIKSTQDSVAVLIHNAGPYRNVDARMGDVEPLAVFAARDAQGNLFNLLAFMPGGELRSDPLKKFVSAQVGGMTMLDTELADWGGYVFAQRDANGVLYAVSGVKADGTQYLPGYNAGVSKGALIHILMNGQSNAAADDAKPPLSTAATGWGSLMFSRGITTWSSTDHPTTPASRVGFALVPMVASGVETRANGLADAYKARLTGASRFSPPSSPTAPDVLVSFAGLGGRKLTELGPEDDGASGRVGSRPPGGHWPTLMDDIVRGKAAAAAAGRAYHLPGWIYDQGESEGDLMMYVGGATSVPSVIVSSYATKLLAMAVAFDTQARAITGEARPFPLFITPPSYNQLTPTAMLDVADASPLVFIVGPRYQMPSAKNASNGLAGASQNWGNEIHYAPDGQRWIGEMCAKVMHRVVNEGEDWQPLRVLSAAKVDATHIDLVFHVPRPPLVIDTTLMPKARGFGVTIVGGSIDASSGTRQTASAAELLADGRTVRLTFPSIPSGAILSVGQSTCDLPAMVVAAVGVGAPTAAGFATYTVSVAGDLRPALKALTDEGAFWVTALLPNGTPTALGVARSVTFDGTYTVLTGETRELRTGSGYGPFVAGDTLTLRRMNPYTNFRDSDNLLSLKTFAAGPRAGKPYPLHNWACQYEAMPIQGS